MTREGQHLLGAGDKDPRLRRGACFLSFRDQLSAITRQAKQEMALSLGGVTNLLAAAQPTPQWSCRESNPGPTTPR